MPKRRQPFEPDALQSLVFDRDERGELEKRETALRAEGAYDIKVSCRGDNLFLEYRMPGVKGDKMKISKRRTRLAGSYQGHSSRAAWNVSLWVNNDEGLYNLARSLCRRMGKRAAAEEMMQILPKKTPDGSPYSVSSLMKAMSGMSCKRGR